VEMRNPIPTASTTAIISSIISTVLTKNFLPYPLLILLLIRGFVKGSVRRRGRWASSRQRPGAGTFAIRICRADSCIIPLCVT
jgi:hypothetical protein